MTIKCILFVTCLLTANCLYSQDGYPKKKVIDKDTVILISAKQLVLINLKKIEADTYKELYNETLNGLTDCISLSDVYKRSDSIAGEIIKIKDLDIADRTVIIERLDQVTKQQSKEIHKLKRNNAILKVTGVILAASTFLLLLL